MLSKKELAAARRNAAHACKKAREKARKIAAWTKAREKMEAEKIAKEAARVKREAEAAERNRLAGFARISALSPVKVPKDPRILTIDIESAPIEAYVWGLWDQNVGLDFIKTDWTILSYAAQWFGERKMIYADTGGRGADKVRDDYPLLSQLWELLNEADIVVAQNGKRFDVRKINARLIQHGYTPYSPIRVIDTMVEAKRCFAFTSQKLAWTSKLLTDTPKSEHKKFPGFELWIECLKDNPEAWKVMRKYNCQDIRSTSEVYKKLRPWIKNHPNVTTFDLRPGGACPNCGSTKVKHTGSATLQSGIYAQYQCLSCGAWPRGKQLLNPLETRKSKLV